MKAVILFHAFTLLATAEFPAAFDLRDVNGKNYVSAVKSQSGGTCWTHGTMAAVESNLLKTGAWQADSQTGDANLAEYHLDWWNGFNQKLNADIAPQTGGLTVHQGGDYRVASAYLARGGGAVRDVDAQSFSSAPKIHDAGYHYYYVRDIEWLNAGSQLENIATIKQALMDHGVVGTALTWDGSFFNSSSNTFYQSPSSSSDPNHAVAIVGWDDNKKTAASKPGAWLIKNSWGEDWGDGGFFWISYYDKISGHHPEMGAVSFQNTERMKYDNIYSHDYHGWRDTKKSTNEAFNAFTATGKQTIKSVSIYTTDPGVFYTTRIFKKFDGSELSDEVSSHEGYYANSGFHTVDLNYPVYVDAGEKFYVYLQVSNGGQAFDRTSNVPVLLGSRGRVTVVSKASAGESYYWTGSSWKDFTQDEKTGNFCIKALSVNR